MYLCTQCLRLAADADESAGALSLALLSRERSQLWTMSLSIWILAGGIVQNAARYPRGLCTVDCGRTYDGIKKLRRRKGAVLPRAWRWSAAGLAEIVRPRGPLFGEADDRGSATRCWQAGKDKQEAARVPSVTAPRPEES